MVEKLNQIRRDKIIAPSMAGICIAGLIGCLLLLSQKPPMSVALFFVIFLFYILVFRKQSKKYQKAVKTATLEECFRPNLKNITYQEKDGLDPDQLAKAHLIPIEHPEQLLIRDTVKGTYQAMPAFLSDVTCDFQSSRTNRQGEQKEFPDYLSGNWFEIRLRKELPFSFTVWDKELVPESARSHFFDGWQNTDILQSPDFRSQFHTYTRDLQGIPLPENLAKSLLRLAEFTPGRAAAELDGNTFRIFIQNRFLYIGSISPRVEITPQILQHNQYQEIHSILRVVDTLL